VVVFFFFQKKKQKAFVLLRRKRFGDPKLGEADPGGLGACPQKPNPYEDILLFPEKAKSVCSASQKTV
jgi:hypothetical protein